MSEPILRVTGTAAPLMVDGIDTDQIMPKQFLKRIERHGFGPYVFHDWRQGREFVLDQPQFLDATLLLAGADFGCGSSREQAVWGLLDAGIRAVIAPSFAPIFVQNSLRSRLLTIPVPREPLERLAAQVRDEPTTPIEIDLVAERIRAPGHDIPFELDPQAREVFVRGTDHIERTLTFADAIAAHETQRADWLPVTRPSNDTEKK